MGKGNSIFDALSMTERDFIEWVVSKMFLIDFGTVAQYPGTAGISGTADIDHSVQPNIGGQQQGTTRTNDVELLWPGGGAEYSESWDVKQGDPVMLWALKDYVPTVANAAPQTPQLPIHYNQETMKAMILGPKNSSSAVRLVVTGDKWQLSGATEIDLSGNTHPLVLGDALQTAITAWIAQFQIPLTTLGVTVPPLNISAAESTIVKAGG